MKLKDIAQQIAKDTWGFVPARDIKPVHFANGFFRALSGRTGDPDLVQKAAGAFKKGKSNTTTEQLIEDIRDRVHNPDNARVKERVKELRAALDVVLSQDKALYASARTYSFTLTHWLHTSSDASDQRSGRLMTWLLQEMGRSDTIDALREALDETNDAIYELTAPLLDASREMKPVGNPDAEVRALFDRVSDGSSAFAAVADGFDQLTRHASHLDKTAFLQRLVTFGGFALYHHVVNSTEEAHEGRRVPMLLCAPDPSIEVKDVSRNTFQLSKRRIREAFEEGISRKLDQRNQADLTKKEYFRLMHGWLIQAGMKESARKAAERREEQFREDFEAERAAVDSDAEAFIRASVPVCFAELGSKDPASCVKYMGVHSGFVGPFRGRGERYYRALPQFLDALVATILKPGEQTTEKKFWKMAWKQYGILCGARSQHDLRSLEDVGIRKATANELTKNARNIRDELTRLGYARTYADSATLIQSGS